MLHFQTNPSKVLKMKKVSKKIFSKCSIYFDKLVYKYSRCSWFGKCFIGLLIGFAFSLLTSVFIPGLAEQIQKAYPNAKYIDSLFKIITIASILSFFSLILLNYANEYCLKYRPDQDMLGFLSSSKRIILNTRLYNIYKIFVRDIASSLRNQIQNLDVINTDHIDLATEVDLTLLKKDKLVFGANDTLISGRAISNTRRERILKICESLLNDEIRSFHATEFHIMDVISDQRKYNADNNYRESLHTNKNITSCSNKKRIIGIKKADYETILNNSEYRARLVQYLQWHIDNLWDARLYKEIDDKLYPLKVIDFGCNSDNCVDLTDFLYVEYSSKDGINEYVVFAQNDNGLCKYFTYPSESEESHKLIIEYSNIFKRLWEHSVLTKEEMVIVDKDLISNIKNYKQP